MQQLREPPTVRVFEEHLEQVVGLGVLFDLLSNAVKYDRHGGTVTVGAGTADGWAHITVADTGPGIPPADVSRIFEPFERLPQTAQAAGGHGLGPTLSRRMAGAMGGRIEVSSTPGHGATFTSTLPLAE